MPDVEAPGTGIAVSDDLAKDLARMSAYPLAGYQRKLKYGNGSGADLSSAKERAISSIIVKTADGTPHFFVTGVFSFDCLPPGDLPDPGSGSSFWGKIGFGLAAAAVGIKVVANIFRSIDTGDTAPLEEDVEEAKQLVQNGVP
jgi:hypothetical protein